MAERLRKLGDVPGENSTSTAFFELIELREKELQLKAAARAENFYAERAKDFGRQLSEHLAAWEAARVAAHLLTDQVPRFALTPTGAG